MTRLAMSVLIVVALVAGCGDDDETEDAKQAPLPAETTAKAEKSTGDGGKERKGATVKVVDSQFGSILADAKGQAYYLFDKEKSAESECYGDCADAWPPAITKGEPRAGSGARDKLVGTTKRRDGKLQLTYRDRPLYYYVDDSPGRVLCHNVNEFGGLWLVVRPNGQAVS